MPPPWLFWKGNLLTITENKGSFMELRGTTILAVRHKGHVALIGDGQVTMGQQTVMKAHAHKVRRIYNGYRINRIGDYIRINPTGAMGLLVGMAVLLAFPPSPFFVSEVMLFRETIAGGRWWVAGTVLLLLCIVIYSFCVRMLRLCYQPQQDSLHPAPARNALSWAAFSLLAAAMVVGIWQPALLQQLIDQIVSL